MDGISRNATALDAELVDALGPLLTLTIVGLGLVLGLALSAEILRRAGVATGTVRRLDRIVPPAARRIAVGAVGVALTVLGPTSASASDSPLRDWLTGTTTTTTAPATPPTTGPVATEDALVQRSAPPVAPVAPPPPAALPQPAPTSLAAPAVVVVLEGDCLWSIAARRIGRGATNIAIDAAWRAIYARNRAAIGDDPNLIFPGLQLALPPIGPSPHAAP